MSGLPCWAVMSGLAGCVGMSSEICATGALLSTRCVRMNSEVVISKLPGSMGGRSVVEAAPPARDKEGAGPGFVAFGRHDSVAKATMLSVLARKSISKGPPQVINASCAP